jgi:hypothetical protein
MNATYGFHATMTARPGPGDRLVARLLTAMTGAGPAPLVAAQAQPHDEGRVAP